MRNLPLTPVTEVKRRATEIIARVQRDRQPVLITARGRSAAVLLDVPTYEDMRERLELLEGIARGERAIDEGRVFTHAAVKRRLQRWRGRRG